MKHARRHGAIQHDEPAVDYGATGQAQKVRPSAIAETIQAGVTYRQMHDTHPIDVWDRSAQLSERQVNAAWMLTKAFVAGRYAERSVTAAYGASRGGDSSPEAAVAQTIARRNYGGWMDRAPADTRHVLARMVRAEYPGVSCGLQLVRKGLDAVADDMRLPRETFTNGKGWGG